MDSRLHHLPNPSVKSADHGMDLPNVEKQHRNISEPSGSPPTDPTVGFLPPNHATSGQGFVIFSIKPSDQVQTLEKIKAKAFIIFDKNEPIDTPEIFNTVDDKPPYINNISILPGELTGGSVVLKLDIRDDESGLDYVDIMLQTGDDGYIPLLNNVRGNLVSLPLQPRHSYKVAVFPVDRIGNLMLDKYDTNIIEIITPPTEVSCSDVQNCSGNGNCTGINLCMCNIGFYGNDCSTDTVPLDPPVIEMLAGSQQNISVPLYISSKTVNSLPNTTIILICTGFPTNSSFTRGHIIKEKLFLSAQDFGDLYFVPPSDYHGNFILHVEAVASVDHSTSERSRTGDLLIKIEKSVTDHDRSWFLRKYIKTTFQALPALTSLGFSAQEQTSAITKYTSLTASSPLLISSKTKEHYKIVTNTFPSTHITTPGNTKIQHGSKTEINSFVSKQTIFGGIVGGIAAVCVPTCVILYVKRWWIKYHKYTPVNRGTDKGCQQHYKETTV